MTELQSYAIRSAELYLDHLERTNGGLEEVRLKGVRLLDTKLVIYLESMPNNDLFGVEHLRIQLDKLYLSLDYVEEKRYIQESLSLEIDLEDGKLEVFFKSVEEECGISIDSRNLSLHLKLFIDFKFLVKNILNFCKRDLILDLPTTSPLNLILELDPSLSSEQRRAVEGVFSQPVSYIWGLSGSGKTQVVLFSCLLNIMRQERKALILAPTNTALEQIFSVLIKKSDIRGIGRQRFLRLGMPSFEFFHNFPEVCAYKEREGEEDGAQIFATSINDRLDECFVVGLTLDSFVLRYDLLRDLEISHIFIDECAFAPLIKLIPPMQLRIPITLLGDHRQLSPICLMEEKEIRQSAPPACLWSLSTLFIESWLANHKDLHKKSIYDDPLFRRLAHYKLTTTYRYGNNLAQVLDMHVYRVGLRGLGKDAQVYFVDSRAYGLACDGTKNESHGEANAISRIVGDFKDYAVITPFRHQRAFLKKFVPNERLFTIHRAQGREFDTVIFSPVKLSRYLTDSSNRGALFALNVALSRLKKELILVCDYGFWIRRENQFICSLLRIAKPYEMQSTGLQRSYRSISIEGL